MAHLKKVILFFFILGSTLISLSIFYNRDVLTGYNFSKQFETVTLAGKDKGFLDLTEFESNKWDEMIVWFPYSSLQEYNISLPLFLNKKVSNSDDGSNTILFLKNNRITGWASFERSKVDLNSLRVGTSRIPRVKAQFNFGKELNFTKIYLIK